METSWWESRGDSHLLCEFRRPAFLQAVSAGAQGFSHSVDIVPAAANSEEGTAADGNRHVFRKDSLNDIARQKSVTGENVEKQKRQGNDLDVLVRRRAGTPPQKAENQAQHDGQQDDSHRVKEILDHPTG